MLTALPNTQLSRRLHKEGRLFYRFSHLDKNDPGDACTAGLIYVTLRLRREIMEDFRDTVVAVYAPEAFFDRVRRLGRALDRLSFPSQKLNFWLIAHDLRAFVRMA